MNGISEHGHILVAEDDPTDAYFFERAFRRAGLPVTLHFVRDGQEAIDYLQGEGQFADRTRHPLPQLLLLDLKMPRKDGREALSELKADPRLRSIPIVVLTTSTAADDVGYCYAMGVNSYVTKPATFRGLVELMETLGKYWFDLVELPAVE